MHELAPQGEPRLRLRILQDENKNLEVLAATEARTRKSVDRASLTVSTFSYGAWARLKVEAVDEDQKQLKVNFQGMEVQAIPLPYYTHNDHIAMAWLKQKGMLGKPADWDGETEPPGKGNPGDGLTLYEEYRGFSVKGKYVTGHPTKKDLFICDQTEQESKGIDLFERITGLVVHRVTLAEMGETRVLNRNHSQAPHIVDQHALWIIRGNGSFEAVGVQADSDPGPPRTCRFVKVPAPEAGLTPDDLAAREALIAHELCHGVGVYHHGDSGGPRFWYWKQDQPGAWQLYEDDLNGDSDADQSKLKVAGKPRSIRAVREADRTELKHGQAMPSGSKWDERLQGYKLLIFGKQSPCSGDTACVMRYVDRQAWLSNKDPTVRYIPDKKEKALQDSLCSSGEGTGVNSLRHGPEPRYGNAQQGRGNCKDQIVVSDK